MIKENKKYLITFMLFILVNNNNNAIEKNNKKTNKIVFFTTMGSILSGVSYSFYVFFNVYFKALKQYENEKNNQLYLDSEIYKMNNNINKYEFAYGEGFRKSFPFLISTAFIAPMIILVPLAIYEHFKNKKIKLKEKHD